MHIAQVAPLTEAIPPKLYGGTERVVSWLTEELIGLGHEVTLFASGDSMTSAHLEAVWPRALRLDGAVRDPNALHMLLLERVYQRAGDFDFLHCHLDYYPFSLFSRQPTPFVTTLHGRLDLPEHQPVFDAFSSIPLVSISNSQRRPLPQANWVRTVHHGLPEKLLTPKPIKPSYFAFLGIFAVGPVDFGGDLERHAAMLGDADGAIEALFRSDTAEEGKIRRLDRFWCK